MTLKTVGVLAIAASTLIATILSMTVDMEGYELGALFNLFIPCFLGIIAILVYLIAYWLIKSKEIRVMTILLFCYYLLYVGLSFQLNKEHLPYPFLKKKYPRISFYKTDTGAYIDGCSVKKDFVLRSFFSL
jgi:hypothetical protein